jgi:hypothetical protein
VHDWTCTEVALDLLLKSPRTSKQLRSQLEATQTLLVEADRAENKPTLTDKAQKSLVDNALRYASAAAQRLWEDTWQRVTRYVEASTAQLQKERADATRKFL